MRLTEWGSFHSKGRMTVFPQREWNPYLFAEKGLRESWSLFDELLHRLYRVRPRTGLKDVFGKKRLVVLLAPPYNPSLCQARIRLHESRLFRDDRHRAPRLYGRNRRDRPGDSSADDQDIEGVALGTIHRAP